MSDLLPFRGLRYAGRADLSTVTAPPYDVIDDDEQAVLERADEHNAVRLILPRSDADRDRYASAAATLAAWRTQGLLMIDDRPSLYAYRMSYDGADGTPHRTVGVIGALSLPARSDTTAVRPHERTLPKARSDRLALLRATRANLDPIWCLAAADSLTAAIGDPAATATAVDAHGTRHEIAVLDADGAAAVGRAVAAAPLVLADGHHRFETACAYRDEHPGDPAAGAVMALVVELSEQQLCVRPIHRLLTGAPDLRTLAADAFVVEPAGPNRPEGVSELEERMRAEGALGLVDGKGLALLRPRPDVLGPRVAALPAPLPDVDAARFDVTLRPALGDALLGYRDDAATVAGLVEKGAADAAVLLRAVTVEQIRAAAFAGVRMPEKTTFFAPKPRTGMVFRVFDA